MLARRARARLRVVTVVEEGLRAALEAEPSYIESRRGTTLEDVIGEYELFARRSAEKALAALEGHDEVESEVESWVGQPAHALIEFSKRLDMLVCGSRGYGPLRSVLLGAVSSQVVAAAHCPVTVVPRGRESRLELLLGEAPRVAART
jgi:nucleotide-binding universal stress UspA family protein